MAGKVSAGVLLYRRGGEGVEVLLVHPGGPFFKKKDAGSWTIPKGEVEEGEELLARARIEFCEEVGAEPPKSGYIELGSVVQKGGKRVHGWGCEGEFVGPVRSNVFGMEWPPGSGQMHEFPEVDRAEWFGIEEAKVNINAAQVELIDRLVRAVA